MKVRYVFKSFTTQVLLSTKGTYPQCCLFANIWQVYNHLGLVISLHDHCHSFVKIQQVALFILKLMCLLRKGSQRLSACFVNCRRVPQGFYLRKLHR